MHIELLEELLALEPATGILNWKTRAGHHFKNSQSANAWNTKYSGKQAGYKRPDGYISVAIFGKRQLAHRIIWALENREWPSQDLDHKDQNRSNNQILNLRLTTKALNARNTGKNKNNTSGFKNVSWAKKPKKWRADIKVNRKPIFLGFFDSAEAAAEAAKQARTIHHGEFAAC